MAQKTHKQIVRSLVQQEYEAAVSVEQMIGMPISICSPSQPLLKLESQHQFQESSVDEHQCMTQASASFQPLYLGEYLK